MNKTKRIFALTTLVMIVIILAMLSGCTQKQAAPHVHEIEKVEPKAATCSKDGNREYYVCVVCDETFADVEGVLPLASEKYLIPAKGHNIAVHGEKSSTCTSEGIKEYFECRNCHTLFHDAEGMFMIMEPQTLPTITHEIVKVEGRPAVGFVAGWLEHYTCIHCNALYKDANGLVATNKSELKVAPVLTDFEYKIAFTPAANLVDNGGKISAQYVEDSNGLPATEFTVSANAPVGTETYAWIHDTVSSTMSQGLNLRIPTFSGHERKLEMTVTNNGTEEISFRFYAESYGDKGGINITIAAGETKTVEFGVNPGTSIGCNYVLVLLSSPTTETKLVINGYFHCEGEVDAISIYKKAAKTSFKVGESFTTEGLVIKAEGNGYDQTVISNYLTDIEEGYVFTASDVGTHTVTVAYGEYTVTYKIEVSQ